MESNFLVISTSLNPESRSRILAKHAYEKLSGKGRISYLDLADYQLPICDGDTAYANSEVRQITDVIQDSKGIILSTPVYNYSASSSAKNLIELTGDAWEEKTVGFLCAAGGRLSYMAIMGLANSLMLDYRCIIIPRFVFADGSAFSDGKLIDSEVATRVEELTNAMIKMHG